MTNDDRVRFTFRIPTNLMNSLKQTAKIKGVSLNALILQILWEWVKEQKKSS